MSDVELRGSNGNPWCRCSQIAERRRQFRCLPASSPNSPARSPLLAQFARGGSRNFPLPGKRSSIEFHRILRVWCRRAPHIGRIPGLRCLKSAPSCHFANRSIQSVQQESLVVIYLDIAAECSIRERNSRGHVEQSGFLRFDLDKWLLPICDGRPPARIDESDIGEQSRAAGVPNKNAAIVHPTLYDRSRKIHHNVGG